MKSLKTKRIFVLIWVMLALSVLSSIWVMLENTHNLPKLYSKFWVMLFRIVHSCILIIISFKLWQIVTAYTNKNNWQPQFYQKIRQIGYWAIVLTLLSPIIETAIVLSSTQSQFIHNLYAHRFITYLGLQFLMMILSQSSAMWVFTLSIFLFAELLQIANQIKAENESII